MNQKEKENNCCPHCSIEEHKREPLWRKSESDFCEIEDFENSKRIAICRNAVEFDWSFITINFCPICGRDFSI
jgi:ribosomal protein S12 methylthiotransferase accessory factor YcaO